MAQVGVNNQKPNPAKGPGQDMGRVEKEKEGAANPPCYWKTMGSLTVEAALAVPLWMAALVTLIFLLSAMYTQVRLQWALYEQLMKVNGYSYYLSQTELDEELEVLLEAEYVKLAVINQVGQEFFDQSFIVGKEQGIYLNITDGLEEGMIDAALEYRLQAPYDLLGIGRLTMVSRARCREWTGKSLQEEGNPKSMVYVTAEGSVYHCDRGCKYINVKYSKCSYAQIQSLRNPDGKIYYPCQYCCEQDAGYEEVYYMNYGTRYHSDVDCKNFHRNVYMLDEETAKERYPACSNCGGN